MSTRPPKLSLAQHSAAFSSPACEEAALDLTHSGDCEEGFINVTNPANYSQKSGGTVSQNSGHSSISGLSNAQSSGTLIQNWTDSKRNNIQGLENRSNSFSGKRNIQLFSKYRASSLDVDDEYFLAKFPARRRSSCKEVILHFFKNDKGNSGQTNQPQFLVTEEERHLSVVDSPNDDHKRPLPNSFDSSMENIPEGGKRIEHIELNRSLSEDGSNPKCAEETHHLLHKSMPDLYAHDKLRMESLKEAWGPKLGGRGAVRHLKKLRSTKDSGKKQERYGANFWKQMF